MVARRHKQFDIAMAFHCTRQQSGILLFKTDLCILQFCCLISKRMSAEWWRIEIVSGTSKSIGQRKQSESSWEWKRKKKKKKNKNKNKKSTKQSQIQMAFAGQHHRAVPCRAVCCCVVGCVGYKFLLCQFLFAFPICRFSFHQWKSWLRKIANKF